MFIQANTSPTFNFCVFHSNIFYLSESRVYCIFLFNPLKNVQITVQCIGKKCNTKNLSSSSGNILISCKNNVCFLILLNQTIGQLWLPPPRAMLTSPELWILKTEGVWQLTGCSPGWGMWGRLWVVHHSSWPLLAFWPHSPRAVRCCCSGWQLLGRRMPEGFMKGSASPA